MKIGSLFSGIGGFDKGIESAIPNSRPIWFAENNKFCQAVLRKHWPEVKIYEDVRAIDASAGPPDIILGGFPCQPVSVAGKRKAQEDSRWLWPECARLITLFRPKYAIFENVPGLLSRGFGDVLKDLQQAGYDAEWTTLSAKEIGAPQKRERLFIVAYPNGLRSELWRKSRDMVSQARSPESEAQQRERSGDASGNSGPDLANAEKLQCDVSGDNTGSGLGCGSVSEPRNHRGSSELANTHRQHVERLWTSGVEVTIHSFKEEVLGCHRARNESTVWSPKPIVDGTPDGVGARLHASEWERGISRLAKKEKQTKQRLMAIGNAVVPQCAQLIGEYVNFLEQMRIR